MKYIYGLHAGDGEVRYVGRTVDPHTRLRGHRNSPKSAAYAWAQEIGPKNMQMVILEEFEETLESTAADRELAHILKYMNPNLLNRSTVTGGHGTINRPRPPKPVCTDHHMTGRHHSEDTKAKIAERVRWQHHNMNHTLRNLTKPDCMHCTDK